MIFRLSAIENTPLYNKLTSAEHHQIKAKSDTKYCKSGETISIHNPMFWLIQDDFFDAEWKKKMMNGVESFLLDNNQMISLQEVHDLFEI